jgi:hypothetical protein
MPHFFPKIDSFKIKVQLVILKENEISLECADPVKVHRHHALVLIKQYTDTNSIQVNITNYWSPNRNTSYLHFLMLLQPLVNPQKIKLTCSKKHMYLHEAM